MKPPKSRIEVSLKRGKVQSFLEDLITLCSEHRVSIETNSEDTSIQFHNWDSFYKLEVDFEGASLYWPRIETEIVVRRKHEDHKVVSREETKSRPRPLL